MKISVGADERLHIVNISLDYLKEKGHHVIWHGPDKDKTHPWPEVARRISLDVQSAEADEGILFCWTGTGVSIAANKFKGIRAALCDDAETARGARLWNNANVLCLSMQAHLRWFSKRFWICGSVFLTNPTRQMTPVCAWLMKWTPPPEKGVLKNSYRLELPI